MKLPKLLSQRLDALATFLNSRNAREKYMLITLIGVLIFVVDYFAWLAPVLRTYTDAAPRVTSLREDRRTLKDDLKSKDKIIQKWKEAQADMAEKDKMFVSTDQTPALLENLSKEAQRTGVRIMSLEPSDAQKIPGSKSDYRPVPLQLKAHAGTHELGAFLSNLETGSTFFRVTNLRIAEDPTNERKHLVELTMDAYKREK